MQKEELVHLIDIIINLKAKTDTIEFKKTSNGIPENLYDTFSSFSNTQGGIIIFGIDEKNNYEVCGISSIDLLQKKITEQSLMMHPEVCPIITITTYHDKTVAACEIPELDVFYKPCYYLGKGKMKGSYIRVGDADLPMNEYEIYSYDAFKYKTEDELRIKDRIDNTFLNTSSCNYYIDKIVTSKPNLMNVDKDTILKLNGILDKNGMPTLCGILNFGKYPQYFSPNLDIVAVRCSNNEYGIETDSGVRFIDNKRLDGTISEMLKQAISFVINNTKKQLK